MTADDFEDFDGPETELARGREALPHTPVHDWVALADISPAAVALYLKMRMHLNRERGDKIVWPSTLALAMLMGRSRGDKIAPEIKELDDLGAIDVTSYGMPRRHVYMVHETPPDGYAGPLMLKDWYTRNRPALDDAKAKAKADRDARRTKKAQVSPVDPDRGQQGTDALVDPDRGQQVTPDRGQHVDPISGREQGRKEPRRKEPTPPTPQTDPAGPSGEGGVGKDPFENPDADLNTFVAWFHDQRPDWRRTAIAKTLTGLHQDRRCRGVLRSAALVLRDLVADQPHGRTDFPGRAAHDGLWWAVLRPKPAPEQPTRAARCGKHPWEPRLTCQSCLGEAKGADCGGIGAELPADPLRQLALDRQLQRVLARNVRG